MYVHPQIFGAQEYFQSDVEFHDDCLGCDESEYASDDDYSDWILVPPKKHTKSCSCQTEPWEPPKAEKDDPPTRLAIFRTGMKRPNPQNRPVAIFWDLLGQNSLAAFRWQEIKPRKSRAQWSPRRRPTAGSKSQIRSRTRRRCCFSPATMYAVPGQKRKQALRKILPWKAFRTIFLPSSWPAPLQHEPVSPARRLSCGPVA